MAVTAWRLVLFVTLLRDDAHAFEWHAPGQRPEVTRRAIAGLWKITPALLPKYPMKEFTVHGKKKKSSKADDDDTDEPELLLMLKEDGSFQEYASDDDEVDDEESVEDSWKRFKEKQRQEKRKAELAALAKGTWDYRDGKLILAADRPAQTSSDEPSPQATKQTQPTTPQQHQDTLLEGQVVATYETSLEHNPVVDMEHVANTTGTSQTQKSTTATTSTSTSANVATEKRWDAHLTVPKGSVKV